MTNGRRARLLLAVLAGMSLPGGLAAGEFDLGTYRPRPISTLTTSLAPRERVDARTGRKLDMPESTRDPVYTVESPSLLNRPDGAWIDRQYHTPVAPFCHLPLYFEDRSLERWGQTYGCCLWQSLLSAAHFYGTLPLLPYKMAVEPPCRRVPPKLDCPPADLCGKLGRCMGSCRWDAAAVEAAVVTGLILAIP